MYAPLPSPDERFRADEIARLQVHEGEGGSLRQRFGHAGNAGVDNHWILTDTVVPDEIRGLRVSPGVKAIWNSD